MAFSDYEEQAHPAAFKDRRKRKCTGVKGKAHRWRHFAGNDCRWSEYAYFWMTKTLWTYVCECKAVCKDCGTEARNYNGRLCKHKDWRAFTKPKGAK